MATDRGDRLLAEFIIYQISKTTEILWARCLPGAELVLEAGCRHSDWAVTSD